MVRMSTALPVVPRLGPGQHSLDSILPGQRHSVLSCDGGQGCRVQGHFRILVLSGYLEEHWLGLIVMTGPWQGRGLRSEPHLLLLILLLAARPDSQVHYR